MKKTLLICVVLFALSACTLLPSDQSEIDNESIIDTKVAMTSAALLEEPTEEPTEELITEEPTPEPQPTNTSRPTNTTAPTKTQEPTIEPTATYTQTPEEVFDTSRMLAKNYLASDEDGGVIVEVARILIAEKEAVDMDFSQFEEIQDKPTVVMFIFRIVNNSDLVLRTRFRSNGLVAINGEQISLDDYCWVNDSDTWFGDNLNSEMLPGSTMIGGLWVGINRSMWDEVTTITIKTPAYFGTDSYKNLTKEFIFSIDVDNWIFEELPQELK